MFIQVSLSESCWTKKTNQPESLSDKAARVEHQPKREPTDHTLEPHLMKAPFFAVCAASGLVFRRTSGLRRRPPGARCPPSFRRRTAPRPEPRNNQSRFDEALGGGAPLFVSQRCRRPSRAVVARPPPARPPPAARRPPPLATNHHGRYYFRDHHHAHRTGPVTCLN